MQAQKQSIIDRLKEELQEARKSADTLQAELRRAQGRVPRVDDFEACEAVVKEVIKDWPDLTMTHTMRTPSARDISEAEETQGWLSHVTDESERRCLTAWAW